MTLQQNSYNFEPRRLPFFTAQRTQRPEETPPSTVQPDQDERIRRQTASYDKETSLTGNGITVTVVRCNRGPYFGDDEHYRQDGVTLDC